MPGSNTRWRKVVRFLIGVLLLLCLGFAAFQAADPAGLSPIQRIFSAATSTPATSVAAQRIVDRVPTFTQADASIGYDGLAQYQRYWASACSAAVSAEVLTAWGDHHATIGTMIDILGTALSPTAGLVDSGGFMTVGHAEGFAVALRTQVALATLIHIVRDLGFPAIVGVRASLTSAYPDLTAGHFLVVTGSDAQGFQIVDSSLYFIHYLTVAEFQTLWNNADRQLVLFVPIGTPLPSL